MENKHTIWNWFKDETYYYLNEEYPSLNDYYEKLYDVTEGYPILYIILQNICMKNLSCMSVKPILKCVLD